MKMKQKHTCIEKKESNLYRIGMFAQMNHITVKTLRFYEERGLLIPAKIDQESGYRYYAMSQMEKLHKIQALKEMGFSLEDIRLLEASQSEKNFLLKKKSEILTKIADLTRQLAILEGYINGDVGELSTPVRIRTIPATICAAMTYRIESYDNLFDLMPKMGMKMEEAGCECAIPEYCFTHYLDAGYKEENILVEICQAVKERKTDSEGLFFKEFPQMQMACVYHKGSYDKFPSSYAAILKYIETNGYKIVGNIRENYIDGVWNKGSEEEWLSEIQIPVAKPEQEDVE